VENLSFIITGCKAIWLPPDGIPAPVPGKSMNRSNLLEDGWLRVENGLFHSWGSMAGLALEEDIPEGLPRVDARGGFLLPSFCDSHSHLVFAAWRQNEMEMRLAGKTYLEIAESGGGILNSAARLRETPENDLFDSAWERFGSLLRMGTGALEIKSGYGLDTESELKMLRVIRRIREKSPVPVRATFLGAHAIPRTFTDRREYIRLVCQTMIPAVAAEGLADYCDVFCDTGFFTEEESVEILEAGIRYGLQPKIHANELARSGGVQAAARVGAVSADHLECLGEEELQCLENSAIIPVLLPGTAFFLGIHPPDARTLINRNLPVALASDYNPGTCPSGNMEFVLSLASFMLKMTFNESFHAATINGAYAMGLGPSAGRIAAGLPACFMLTHPLPALSFLPYHFGETGLASVYVNGRPL
jgi:imidazolonepropionase